jgi:hypothetical protein
LNKYFGAGQTISGANFFYSKDLMNTVRELTNSAGTIQAVYGYDPLTFYMLAVIFINPAS